VRQRAETQQLAVTLLADESGAIARSFGIAAKVGEGDAGGMPPATVIIDRQGVVAARVPRDDPVHHVEQVLHEVRVSR
jgi:peroxiredoxin